MLELMWKPRSSKNEKGFTLVELIVVAAIIGILASIGVARMGEFGNSARARSVGAEHRMLISAILMWQSQQPVKEAWPSDLVELQTYISGGTASLGSPKGNSNVSAHVLGGNSPTGTLTSTYDAVNTWIYDQSK